MVLSHYYIMISLYYNYSSCLTGHGLVTIPWVNHGQPMTITWTPSLLISHLPIHFLDQSRVKKTGLRTPLQIYCACHGLPKLRAFYMEENMVLYLIHVQHAPNKKLAPTATNLLCLPWVSSRLCAFCMEKHPDTWETKKLAGPLSAFGFFKHICRIHIYRACQCFWRYAHFTWKTNNLRHFQHSLRNIICVLL